MQYKTIGSPAPQVQPYIQAIQAIYIMEGFIHLANPLMVYVHTGKIILNQNSQDFLFHG